ncbi:MAG TPA: hypothetical protein VNS55_12235 [Nocardioides sp.]|nr:hypothetical protein [Nocardioides sp.]
MTDDEEHERGGGTLRPVVSGLLALAAVALTVGLVLGGVALVGSEMLGLAGDDSSAAGDASNQESLYLPPFHKTTDNGPAITLATEDGQPTAPQSTQPEQSRPSRSKSPDTGRISLQAVETSVGNFEHIDLTGVYPGGEGAVLQVQRLEGGVWTDFEATIPVSNETFSTYIQTGVSGLNRFRVIDNATGVASNEVRVQVE